MMPSTWNLNSRFPSVKLVAMSSLLVTHTLSAHLQPLCAGRVHEVTGTHQLHKEVSICHTHWYCQDHAKHGRSNSSLASHPGSLLHGCYTIVLYLGILYNPHTLVARVQEVDEVLQRCKVLKSTPKKLTSSVHLIVDLQVWASHQILPVLILEEEHTHTLKLGQDNWSTLPPTCIVFITVVLDMHAFYIFTVPS